MKKFIIIDAPCGAGKSSWAIQNIKQRGENIIVCTPFLDEIERYQKDCRPKIFVQPDNYGHSKIEDFNAKLAEGRDIGVTHATFLNATEETFELIRQGRYSLFLDEAIDLIGDFNMTRAVENDVSQRIGKKDLDMLLKENLIEVDPKSYKVSWIGESYDGGKFSAIEQAAKSGSLYLVRGEFLARVFPPKIFETFESMIIMTYILEGSYMQAYFDMYGIEYELKSLEEREDGYHLVDLFIGRRKKAKGGDQIKCNNTL